MNNVIYLKDAKKKNKLGVAEANKEAILNALENIVTFSKDNINSINNSDLFELGLLGNDKALKKRIFIEEKLSLGHGSAKTFLKRLNMINVTKEELTKLVKED